MYFLKRQSPEAIFIDIVVLESHIMQLKKIKLYIYQINFILLKVVTNCKAEYKQLFGNMN